MTEGDYARRAARFGRGGRVSAWAPNTKWVRRRGARGTREAGGVGLDGAARHLHGNVDEHRRDHAANRRNAGQDGLADRGEGAEAQLLLDLEADEKEEDRHQALHECAPDGV